MAGNWPNSIYNNFQVGRVQLEQGVWFGIQCVKGDPPSTNVLSFYPDGSANASMWIFVTDDEKLNGVTVDDNDNDARYAAYYNDDGLVNITVKGHPNLRMIRVLQSGLIRLETGKL
jgi:hypothetical protein